MKAAVLINQDGDLEIKELRYPSKLSPGQVLVKILYSSISSCDVARKRGDKHLPCVLGNEGVGFVFLTGPGVSKVKNDDLIIIHKRKGSGIDANPPKYKDLNTGETIKSEKVATFMDMAVVSENRITKIPICFKEKLKEACLLGNTVSSGIGLVEYEAELKMGQRILVIGCGEVGLNVIQGARMLSAGYIACIEPNIKGRNVAEKFGADVVFDAGIGRLLLGSSKFDVVVDTTGICEYIKKGLKATKKGGKLILAGLIKDADDMLIFDPEDNYEDKVIIFSKGGSHNFDSDIERYINLVISGRINLENQIGDIFFLNDINEAIEEQKLSARKVLVETR